MMPSTAARLPGILNGNGDGTVTPEAPITRERAMVMLARALGIEPIRKPDLTKYTDAAQVSAYAQGYVAALIEAGIVGGVTADELAPQDNINRASTVTILDRAIAPMRTRPARPSRLMARVSCSSSPRTSKITGAPEGTKIVVADGATGPDPSTASPSPTTRPTSSPRPPPAPAAAPVAVIATAIRAPLPKSPPVRRRA